MARYTAIFLTFLISGLMHAGSDLAVGISWQRSGSIRFFCTQVVGIMLEDGVQAIYRSTRGMGRTDAHSQLWTRLIGYAWLSAFLVWSTPAFIYPMVYMNTGEAKDAFLPFSVITLMRSAGKPSTTGYVSLTVI